MKLAKQYVPAAGLSLDVTSPLFADKTVDPICQELHMHYSVLSPVKGSLLLKRVWAEFCVVGYY